MKFDNYELAVPGAAKEDGQYAYVDNGSFGVHLASYSLLACNVRLSIHGRSAGVFRLKPFGKCTLPSLFGLERPLFKVAWPQSNESYGLIVARFVPESVYVSVERSPFHDKYGYPVDFATPANLIGKTEVIEQVYEVGDFGSISIAPFIGLDERQAVEIAIRLLPIPTSVLTSEPVKPARSTGIPPRRKA